MKYKISYSPTYILDPDSYEWLPLDEDMIAKFDKRGYLNVSQPEDADVQGPPQIEPSTSSGTKDENNDESVAEDADDESLFTSNMPGMMSSEQINSINLDRVVTRINRGFFYAEDLFDWQDESINDSSTPKSVVAGLAAMLGPEILLSTCLDFRRTS
ncbi:hypothetical protein MGN70_000821 [Eutypa lata]|nr:hypothetical protein MGN70_000821 [Eutypa lata]